MRGGTGSALKDAHSGERTASFNPSQEWLLAERITLSRGFRRSELLQRFLLEVCELALSGRSKEISEQRIGIKVFGRPEGYDPGDDNIVRNYARMLRRRLDSYFDGEGFNEPLRLTIPRGAYVPVFTTAPRASKPVTSLRPRSLEIIEPVASDFADDSDGSPVRKGHRLSWVAIVGLAMGLVFATASVAYWLRMRSPVDAEHVLWSRIFENKRGTLIVPADSGLGILENLAHRQASLDTYIDGTFFNQLELPKGLDAENFNDLSRQRYTSAVDLGICAELERLPEFRPDRAQIRFARTVTAEEIHRSNVILLGSVHTNPWVELFTSRLNFELTYTQQVDRSFIINRQPRDGERAIYENGTESGYTYGTVAYLPAAGGEGNVLIVQGLNMAATQAAADILLNAASAGPILRAATNSDGTFRPFEVLVETTSIGASSPVAHIVASRVFR